jgi:hypothetical protein
MKLHMDTSDIFVVVVVEGGVVTQVATNHPEVNFVLIDKDVFDASEAIDHPKLGKVSITENIDGFDPEGVKELLTW